MKTRTSCRSCEGSLEPVLSLGELYVSGFPYPEEEDGLRAPLDLVLCSRCKLLQLRHTVTGESLYRNYWYRSGTNLTMTRALADIATKAESLAGVAAGDCVLDIGCNDGTLLAAYKTKGLYKVGFDPAKNLAPFSRKVADKIIPDFFESTSFFEDSDLRNRRPKIVTTIAMFYDLEDPRRFVSHIKQVMHPDGLWVIQMSYLPLMLKTNDFGNICHEHLEYYSLASLEYLLRSHDFVISDVELNDVNGGSFRVYIKHHGASKQTLGGRTYRRLADQRVQSLLEEESQLGLDNPTAYALFALQLQRIRDDVAEFARQEVRNGKRIYVYGASTKGNTMLQYMQLDRSLIAAAADRNPDKWGRVTAGTRIPIVSETEARAAKPDYFLILPWHFLDEFKSRERHFLLSGGRFILTTPHFALV